nr:MAG TPA: hypothetical protein [Caudoviricetes sp.]
MFCVVAPLSAVCRWGRFCLCVCLYACSMT